MRDVPGNPGWGMSRPPSEDAPCRHRACRHDRRKRRPGTPPDTVVQNSPYRATRRPDRPDLAGMTGRIPAQTGTPATARSGGESTQTAATPKFHHIAWPRPEMASMAAPRKGIRRVRRGGSRLRHRPACSNGPWGPDIHRNIRQRLQRPAIEMIRRCPPARCFRPSGRPRTWASGRRARRNRLRGHVAPMAAGQPQFARYPRSAFRSCRVPMNMSIAGHAASCGAHSSLRRPAWRPSCLSLRYRWVRSRPHFSAMRVMLFPSRRK